MFRVPGIYNFVVMLKFSFSEKATKMCAIVLMVANFCGLLRKAELYITGWAISAEHVLISLNYVGIIKLREYKTDPWFLQLSLMTDSLFICFCFDVQNWKNNFRCTNRAKHVNSQRIIHQILVSLTKALMKLSCIFLDIKIRK